MKNHFSGYCSFKASSNLVMAGLFYVTFLLLPGCKSQGERGKEVAAPAQTQTPVVVKNQPPVLNTSIHQAAMDGDLSQVSMLLDSGIDIDTLDNMGRTALMFAAFNGHSEIIKLLIRKRAEVNLADNNGTTALMMASSGPYPETVKLLLDSNADPNAIDMQEHFSPLMYAASEGQMANVKLLLAYKADPTLKDVDGDDAVTFARNNGHNEIAALIQSFKDKYR